MRNSPFLLHHENGDGCGHPEFGEEFAHAVVVWEEAEPYRK
jgi:hypothetical protein